MYLWIIKINKQIDKRILLNQPLFSLEYHGIPKLFWNC